MTNNATNGENNASDPVGLIGEEALSASSYWKDIIRGFTRNKLAVIGLVMLLVIVILCVGAPLFTRYHPVIDMRPQEKNLLPGQGGHLLGTDDYGRDIWSRLLYGGRRSVLTGVLVAVLSGIFGVCLGCISGYHGGWLDSLCMRFTDIMLSFPFLIIAIALMATLGPSQKNIILALAIIGWPGFARLTRSQVLALKEREYVESARVAGHSDLRIIFNHILPNAMGPIIVQLTLSVGSAILSAASLNFLGLGVDSTLPDWGVMLNQGRSYIQLYPHLTTIPGVAISLTVLAMNWVGDGLRDAFDPRLRK